MKKIGILIQNKSIENIDMSDVKNGNPGVGGSQYHLFLLNQVLNSMNLDSIIFVERNQVGVSNSICYDNFEELIEKIKVFKIEFLIVWPKSTIKYKNLFCSLSNFNIKIITWAHNMTNPYIYKYIINCKAHYRHVVVSRQQKIRLYGSKLYKKTVIIPNIYCESIGLTSKKKLSDNKINIVYIGSLVKEKGVHILTKYWNQIKILIPNAHLHIIGSGSLYSREKKLGPYNIADEEYEKLILSPIINNGQIDDTITFYGALGHEKWDIIKCGNIGIVNPSATSENCPGSALDFQSMNIPVVSRKKNGLIDTVINHKTGLLFCREKELVKFILLALNLDVENNGKLFVKNKYSIKKISRLWVNLLKMNNFKFNLVGSDFFLNANWLKIFYGFFLRKNLIFFLYKIFK